MKKVLKYRWALLCVWIAVTILCTVFQPNLKQILNQKGEVTIGDDAPSKVASKMLENMSTSKGDSLVIVFNDKEKISDSGMTSIKDGISALNTNKDKLKITNIVDPFGTPDAKDQLISEDKTTLMVQVNFEKGTRESQTVIDEFNNTIKNVSVNHYITGEIAISNDYLKSVGKGVDKSAAITIVFILVVLILLFRSVITPFVSLLSVGVSYLCSMGIIGFLINQFDFPITSLTQMFVIIVLFGIGTDYHILLFNRYKEELGNGLTIEEAIVKSYKTAGKTILFSGLTVFIGFASLSFVQFPIYRSANAVAIGIAVLLIEMMTLTPLLMRILAGKLFWPSKKSSGHKDSKLWQKVSSTSVQHPVISLIVIAVILSPIILFNNPKLSFDSLKDLSSDNPSVIGFNIIKDKFGAGKSMPTTIVIESKEPMDNNASLSVLDNMTEKLKKIDGIKQVMSPTQPKGEIIKDFYTNKQTETVVDGLKQANDGVAKVRDGLNKINQSIDTPDFSEVEKLASGTGQIQNGMAAVTGGLTKIKGGIDQGAGGADKISQGIAQLKSGVNSINIGLATLSEKIAQVNGGFTELGNGYKAVPGSISQLKQLITMMEGTVSKIDAKIPNDPDVAALKTMLGKLSTSLDSISSGMDTANVNYDKLNAGLSQINDGLKLMILNTGKDSQLVQGIDQLQKGAAGLSVGLKQGSFGQEKVISSMKQLSSGQEKVKAGQDTLLSGLNKLGGGMTQLKEGLSKSGDGLDSISNGINSCNDFLTQLTTSTKTFYVPDEAFKKDDMTKMLNAYMSPDRKTAKMTIILDYEPYSDNAIDLVSKIDNTIKNQLDGTKLSDAKYGITGVTAHSYDLRKMATHDITFTEVIVLVAIFILLVVIIRSFWIPLFVVVSLVVAYYTSFSAVAFISKHLFSAASNGLSWNVPFFTFISITSLGVDYSIFLLRRFREYPGYSVKDAIVLAAKNIGGVVISAAVILSGTFATLYPSNLIVLMELAIGVVIGLLLLCFVLLPVVLPALISVREKVSNIENKYKYNVGN